MPTILLTPHQVALRLQVAPKTVLSLLRARRLVGVKVGLQWRVEPAALDQFIAEQRQRPVPQAAPSPLLGVPLPASVAELMPKVRRFA